MGLNDLDREASRGRVHFTERGRTGRGKDVTPSTFLPKLCLAGPPSTPAEMRM